MKRFKYCLLLTTLTSCFLGFPKVNAQNQKRIILKSQKEGITLFTRFNDSDHTAYGAEVVEDYIYSAFSDFYGDIFKQRKLMIDFGLRNHQVSSTQNIFRVDKAVIKLYFDKDTPAEYVEMVGYDTRNSGPSFVRVRNIYDYDWIPNTIKPYDPQNFATSPSVINQPQGHKDRHVEIDVTELVKAVCQTKTATEDFYGFHISHDVIDLNQNSGAVFASSEHPNTDLHPTLEIWYRDYSDNVVEMDKLGVNTSFIPEGFHLAVNGKIGNECTVIEPTIPFPDYVFKPEYNLQPLAEIEVEINNHKHLPGLPSAAKVNDEKGFELGQINTMLVEKVEELTLHMIDMNKRMRVLNVANDNYAHRSKSTGRENINTPSVAKSSVITSKAAPSSTTPYWNYQPGENYYDEYLVGTENLVSGYKMMVDGVMYSKKVHILDYEDWPDYVFDADYELMTLAQLKDYVDQYHHLPRVPSAQEVKEQGVSLGDMTKVLLEKVEELTLYCIMLDKKLRKKEQEVRDGK